MTTASSTVNPSSVIASASRARTLTISDQHATIFLGGDEKGNSAKHSANNNNDATTSISSLLKLTLVPFHKVPLAPLSTQDDDGTGSEVENKTKMAEDERIVAEREHSRKVLSFLSQFDWNLTSESGAEYSYYDATFKKVGSNNKRTPNDEDNSINESECQSESKRIKLSDPTIDVGDRSTFKAELISPASQRQIDRAMPSPGLVMIEETNQLYESVTKPFIDSIVSSGSLSWIENVVTGKKEKERLLHDGNDWILNVDTKWRSHPDTFAVKRSDWYQHESVIDLYCLGITKWNDVASLRDLTAKHIPALKEMLQQGPSIIEKVYGIKRDQLRIFVHYQPQFYHFHVHFTRLENDTGVQVERAHLLSDVILNLEMDSDYYKKRTLFYKLTLKDKLYKKIALAASTEKAAETNSNNIVGKDAERKRGHYR